MIEVLLSFAFFAFYIWLIWKHFVLVEDMAERRGQDRLLWTC